MGINAFSRVYCTHLPLSSLIWQNKSSEPFMSSFAPPLSLSLFLLACMSGVTLCHGVCRLKTHNWKKNFCCLQSYHFYVHEQRKWIKSSQNFRSTNKMEIQWFHFQKWVHDSCFNFIFSDIQDYCSQQTFWLFLCLDNWECNGILILQSCCHYRFSQFCVDQNWD